MKELATIIIHNTMTSFFMIDLLFGRVDENAEKLVKTLIFLFSFLPEYDSYLI